MAFVNVRLADDDSKNARVLRVNGVSVSNVVRRAIREEAARLRVRGTVAVESVLEEMRRLHPTPTSTSRRRSTKIVDASDRQQVATLIRSRLRGSR